ncbi:hypothetical protein OG244_06895 [Streptomyces brevispora]|uniref:WXG100-like domain-containing protein n=1 Tax=Streptomyces brevispora TaxID=887462 RepID=UPI002E33E74E|nr:hypothetical protein [Streptomyces brevispora]
MSLEFPPDCAWLFAALTGEVPPNGDEDKLFALAEVHKDLHGKLNNDMKQQIAAALGYTSENFDGDAAAMYQAAMKSFIGEEGLNYFDAVADQAQLLATYTRKAATQLQYTKYMIIAQLVELLFEAIVAAALAFFFGASIQAYLAKCAIVRFLIRSWLGRALMTLLMHQLINVGMGVAMDLLVQWSQLNQGTRDEYEGDLTKGAALSGMIQGFLAGPFQFLGNKLGKKLADLFGKGGGKNLGRQLDEVFPPLPVQGPKGPKGVGPKPPKTFGDDFAKNFADNIPRTTGPGGKAAGDKFVRDIGDTFSKHLGGDKAGSVGRDWARTLLENTGKKDLPGLLDNAIKPLAKQGDGALGKILGQGAADQLGRSAVRAMAQAGVHGTTQGVFEGAHAAVSEGFYNLLFSEDHTFTTSGLTFGSGMVEGRVGHILESAGDGLGGNLRNQALEAGLKLPGAGLESSGGPTGTESGGGTGTNAGSGSGAQSGPNTASDGSSDNASLLSLDDDGTGSDTSSLHSNENAPQSAAEFGEGSGEESYESSDDDSDNSSVTSQRLYDDEGLELLDVSGLSLDEDSDIVSDDETNEAAASGVQPVVGAQSPMPQGSTIPSTTSANTPAASPSSTNSEPKATSSTNSTTSSGSSNSSNSTSSPAGSSSPTTGPNTTSTTPVQEQEHVQEQKQEGPEPKQTSSSEQKHASPQTLSQTETPLSPAESRLARSEHTDDSNQSDQTNQSNQSSEATTPAWTSSQAPVTAQPDTVITIDPETDADADIRIDIDVQEDDGGPGPSNSTPPPPPPPPPPTPTPTPTPNGQLSDEVERFGTHNSDGISGVHLAPITVRVATALQQQALSTLERITGPLTEAQHAEVRDMLATLLSPQALQDNRLMLLSRDGHRITLDVGGRPRSLDVQLQLERPRPSAMFGTGSRMPPHNNEQRQAAAFDSTSTASTTSVRTMSLNPLSNTFSALKGFLTSLPATLSFNVTHQQTSLTSTVSSAVNSTSLLRSTEPASPFDYTSLGRVKEASPAPFRPIPPDRAGVRELGTVTAWFPEHLATPGYGMESGDVFSHEDPAAFRTHLNESPLWVMDSMSDPGSLLREVRVRFGDRLDELAPGSLFAAEKYFGAEHLLGALPVQRATSDPGGSTGTWSPILLDRSGNAVGVFRVTAEVTAREGQDILVGSSYSLERFLERQLKADSLSKVSHSYGIEGGIGGSFNRKPAESDKSFRDFNPGGSVVPKGGYSRQKDQGFGAGATHSVTHNIRTNGGHVLTPVNVVYNVEFIPADGTRSEPQAMPATSARIRTLTPEAARGSRPAADARKPAPTEVARLDAIGLTTTPLRVHGTGVGTVFEQAHGWLRDNGYLPRPGEQAGTLMDERLVKARLENLRKLSMLGSQQGLLGTMDELVDGGLTLHFGKPVPGGGVDRVRLRFTLDRDTRDDHPPVHLTSLSNIHLPSISNLSVPGTSQQSSGISGTLQLGGQMTGLTAGHFRAGLTADYKGTWQTTDTSTVGASVSHTQMILTTNQTTEVFQIPAVFGVEITGGSGPLPSGPFSSGDQPVLVDLAVPEGRTEGSSAAYRQAVLQPSGTPLPPGQETFLLPDSSLVDVIRGSKQLYEAVDAILADLSTPPAEQESAQTGQNSVPQQTTGPLTTQTSDEQQSPMPGAFPENPGDIDESGDGPILPISTSRPVSTTSGNTPTSSHWWATAAGAAKSAVDSVLDLSTVIRQTVSTGDRSDQGLLLHEALHAQLAPAALMSRAHQMVKGLFVIDDLFVPGVSAGTDLVVEVRAVLTNPQDLGTVKQYGETDLGATDSASHQVTKVTSHEGGPGITLKYGQSRAEAEQAAAQPPNTDPSAPRAAKPPTGGAGVKAVYGRGNSRSVTTSASTNVTRVPSEGGTQHRISADITYEVTVRRGHRRVSPLNEIAASVTRTVHVPGGITFLATDDQLRRSGTMLEWIAGEETDTTRPATARLPYRFLQHRVLGLGAVLEATPLAAPLPAPVLDASPAQTPQTSNEQTPNDQMSNDQMSNDQMSNEQTSSDQTPHEQETANTPRPRPTANEDPRRPDLLREQLTELVQRHAPGSLTPGHRNYVPGLAQRIADYTSPAALGALPGRGEGGSLSFTFPYTGGLITRTVTLRVHGRTAWTRDQLRAVTGRRANSGAAVENYSAHSPANVTESQGRTTRWGFTLPGSIVLPTSGDTSRKATVSPSVSGSTTRSDTVSTTLTAEDRVWQRVEGGNEFTLGYVFTADLHFDGDDPADRPSTEVPGRVTLRFAGDHAQQQTLIPLPEHERLSYGIGTADPRIAGPLAIATPLQPIGNEVAYALSNQDELLIAVAELAPELGGDGLSSGSSSDGSAARLTELLHGGLITVDPVRAAAGAGGALTGTAKHPRVTLSTQVFRPRLIDATKNVTVDRVRVTGFSTTSGSSTSRSSAFTLGVSGTLGAKGDFDFGGSAPVLSNQSTTGGQGGGVSAVARHWEKTGTAGLPEAEQGLRTYEVEVDTVTTLTGPTGEVRYATGIALLRLPERDLLGLGVLPEARRGDGVWDLSSPDVRDLTPARISQLITTAGDALPSGAVVQLWLDLGTNPTPDARVEALHRAQSIAEESGQTLELALREHDGTHVWTLRPDSTVFPDLNGAQAQLDHARAQLNLFEAEHGRRAPGPDPQGALRRAADLRAAGELALQQARQTHAELLAVVAGLDRTETEARDALRSATQMLEATRNRLATAAPARIEALARRESMLLDALAPLERDVTAYHELRAAAGSRDEAETGLAQSVREENAARLDLQWHEARQDVDRASAQHVAAGADLLALGDRIARAQRLGDAEVSGLLIPPPSDPTAQSLASLTPQWPAPRAPGDAMVPPSTATNGSRKAGGRAANPVLPHEVAEFHETTTAAVHTERFDPKRVQSRREAGRLDGSMTLIRNHVRRMRLPDGRTVRQFFVTLPVRLTDGLGAQDLAAFQARLQSTLDTYVNTGYVLPDSGDQLHVTAEFVESAEHSEAVTLSQSNGPLVRADQRRWDVGHSDAVLTHEILHYLGLADEYSDAQERPEDRHLFRRNDLASAVRQEGLMVNTRQESLENLPHDYLATIERVSENAVVPLRFVSLDGEDAPLLHDIGETDRLAADDTGGPQQPGSRSPRTDEGLTYLRQPHYASGDQFGIAAALLADPKLSVVITYGKEQAASPAEMSADDGAADRRKAEAIERFYLESNISGDRITVIPAAESKAFFKAFGDEFGLSSKDRGSRVLGVGDATQIVGKEFSTQVRESVKRSWNLDQEQDTAVGTWLEAKGVVLGEDAKVAVLWSRFSGKKREVHIEHDTSYIGIAQIIAGLGDVQAVLIVGDSGAERLDASGTSRGKDKFRAMAAYFNEGLLPGNETGVRPDNFGARVVDLTEFWHDPGAGAWGGNTRTGQFRLFDYLHRHSTTRHLGFRSGNLEAMALMGFPVRYLEEPNSEMGGARMTAWHTAGIGEDGFGHTAHGGLAPGYERLMVSGPPTRSGQHQKSLPLTERTDAQKHAQWHIDDKLAKHLATSDPDARPGATRSRPKGFTHEDLANIDAFLNTGDPGDGIPAALREQVRDIGRRAQEQHAKVEGLEKDVHKAGRGKGAQTQQGQQRRTLLEQQLRGAQDTLDGIRAEFSALFTAEPVHAHHDILRARNAEAQSVTHLLTETPPSPPVTGPQGAVTGPESRLAPDNSVDLPSSQAPGDRQQNRKPQQNQQDQQDRQDRQNQQPRQNQGQGHGQGQHGSDGSARGQGRGRGRGRGLGRGAARGGHPNDQGGARGQGLRTTSTQSTGGPSSSRNTGAPSHRPGGNNGPSRFEASQSTAPTAPTPSYLTPVVQYRNDSFAALTRGTTQHSTLTPESYLTQVRNSVEQARPASYVVNAIVDRQTFAQEGRLQSFIASVLRDLSPEMVQRVAIVIGVNGRVASEADRAVLLDAINTGTRGVDSPVSLAVVGVPMRWSSRTFPFGEARNATLTSDATRQALHGLVTRNSHPYLSFMDFDNYPHTTPAGLHVFDHFARALAFPAAHTRDTPGGRIPPLRPLLMSGGYRIPGAGDTAGRAQLVRETRERWLQHNAGNPTKSLGALPDDLADMVEEFDLEIREDMRARSRMVGQAPFQAYSPEPNLFVDGLSTLLEDGGPSRPAIRFSTNSAEFNGLALNLMHLAAWEIVQDHGTQPGSSLSTAAELLRPAVRGTAFMIDFEGAATQTDLSRLYFGMLQSRREMVTRAAPGLTESQINRHLLRVPQSHLNPVPYAKLFQDPSPAAGPAMSKPDIFRALADLRDSRTQLTNTSSPGEVNQHRTILDTLAQRDLLARLSAPLPTASHLRAGLQPGPSNAHMYAMNVLYGTDAGFLQRSFHEIASTYLTDTGDHRLTTRPGSFFAALAQALTPGTQNPGAQVPGTLTTAQGEAGFPAPSPAAVHSDVRRMLMDLHTRHTATADAQRLLANAAQHGLTVKDLTTRLFTGRVHPMDHVLDDYISGQQTELLPNRTAPVAFVLDGSALLLLDLYARSLGRDLHVTGPDGTPHVLGPGTDTTPLRISWKEGTGWSADRPDKGKGVDRGPRTSSAPAPSTERSLPRSPKSPAPSATTPRRRAELVDNPVGQEESTGFRGARTAAVHTERFDPKLLQLNPRPGRLDGSVTLVRNHVRREQTADGRIVRNFFVTLPFRLTDGLTPADLATHRTRMQAVLDVHVNRGYRLPESGDQLRVTVEFVHAPTHGEAVLLSDSSAPGRADQLHWDLHHDDATVVHELLHYLGLADEYSDASENDPHLFRRDDHASGVRGEGLMANTRQESLENLPYEYLATIERVSDNAVVPLHTATERTKENVREGGQRESAEEITEQEAVRQFRLAEQAALTARRDLELRRAEESEGLRMSAAAEARARAGRALIVGDTTGDVAYARVEAWAEHQRALHAYATAHRDEVRLRPPEGQGSSRGPSSTLSDAQQQLALTQQELSRTTHALTALGINPDELATQLRDADARITAAHGGGLLGGSSHALDHASDLMAMDIDEPEPTASPSEPQATAMDLDGPAFVEVTESEPSHPDQEWSQPATGRGQLSSLAYVNQAFVDLAPPTGRQDLTESEYHSWVQNSLRDDPQDGARAYPVSYVVNAIVSESELRDHPERLQEFLDAVTEGLRGFAGRVAVVVGVNARAVGNTTSSGGQGAPTRNQRAAKREEINETVRRAAASTAFARPLALVPMVMSWAKDKSFPYGTARNNVLDSNANRHLVRSMMDRQMHPYIAFMDFDTYPHVVSTRTGDNTLDTHIFSWFDARLETGEDSLPLRPLMMSGGYRLPRPDETEATARLKELTERRYADLLAEKGKTATSSFEEMLRTVRSEITHDMRVRTRLRGLHPLLPYSPEPNLFVDAAATLLKGAPDRHLLRFGPGGAEFHTLSQTLNRINAWELKKDLPLPQQPSPHPDPTTALRQRWAHQQRLEAQHTRRKVAAENQVLPRRGAAFVVEFEQAAVLTDLSRLVAGRWATGALPQDHVALTNPYQRMFHQSEYRQGDIQAGRKGLQLSPFRDIWGLPEYQDQEVLDTVGRVTTMKNQPLRGNATQPVHTNSPLWPLHHRAPLVHGAPTVDRAPALAAGLDPRLGVVGVPGTHPVSMSIAGKVSQDPAIWAGLDPNNIRLFARALAVSADNPYFLDHLRYFAHEYLPSFRDGHVPAGRIVQPLGSAGTLFRALDEVPHVVRGPGSGTVLQAIWRGLYANTNSLHQVGVLVAEADRHGMGVEELFTRLATGALHSPGESFTELRHGKGFTLGPDVGFLLDQYAGALGMNIEVTGPDGNPYSTDRSNSSTTHRLVIEWQPLGERGEHGWTAHIEALPDPGSKRSRGRNDTLGFAPALKRGATDLSKMLANSGFGGGRGSAT